MDPTTTLVTFLFQTDPSVQTVQLIGSWDNFTACYTMERDVRRGRGQWRGCFSFKNIVYDDEARRDYKRNGGLKMDHTYYYYYEVDGSTEACDPTIPCTTACPYMPGQMVNTLSVPVERTLRCRSASMSSLRQENFRTMDPEAKFKPPNPAPLPAPSDAGNYQTASASVLRHCASSRSLSPAPSWKRLFCRKLQTPDAQRGRELDCHDRDFFTSYDKLISFSPRDTCDNSRTPTPTEGTRTRDISPESLRRFLCEDLPVSRPNSASTERPILTIPDDVGDETDDDDNFATSAVSENLPFTTSLSPPPFQRTASSESASHTTPTNSSSLTLRPAKPSKQPRPEVQDASGFSGNRSNFALPKLETKSLPRWSISAAAGAIASPTSYSPDDEPLTFYDSHDEDDALSSNGDDTLTYIPLLSTSTSQQQTFEGYSLPREPDEGKSPCQTFANLNSPKLLPRGDSGIPSGPNLLGAHIDYGLDDFVNELGWIVEVIGNTRGD